MAKKSRRARSVPPTPVRQAQTPPPVPSAQPMRIARPIRSPAAEVVKDVDFSQEYHYVLEDLKRIAITAGALLVLLIVVALIFA
jgi:hypothetical protein